jgi:hypothetical protein
MFKQVLLLLTIQRGQGQILSLFFWNFVRNIKIIDKNLFSAEKRRVLKLGHQKKENIFFVFIFKFINKLLVFKHNKVIFIVIFSN